MPSILELYFKIRVWEEVICAIIIVLIILGFGIWFIYMWVENRRIDRELDKIHRENELSKPYDQEGR